MDAVLFGRYFLEFALLYPGAYLCLAPLRDHLKAPKTTCWIAGGALTALCLGVTRTRDFAPQFAEALSLADELILLPIYPAREQPIEGVTSEIILKDVTCHNKKIYSKENLLTSIQNLNFEVLLTAGAGDIINLLPQICEEVKKQKH